MPEARVLAGHGGDRRSAKARADQASNGSLKLKPGNSAAYIEARLEKLTRSGGNPVRTLELLFAVLDEAEDKELAGRIRRHLRAHGITRDSVEVAAARPLPEVVIGKGKAGPGRGKKTADQISRLSYGTGSSYLAARLARDHAGLAAEVEAGRMSLRVAAKEAGIVKPPDPGRRLVKSWAAATPEQRAAFVNDHAEELRRMLEQGRS
jgi:hypothetical protein